MILGKRSDTIEHSGWWLLTTEFEPMFLEPLPDTEVLNIDRLQAFEALAAVQRSMEALRASEEKFSRIFRLILGAKDFTRLAVGVV